MYTADSEIGYVLTPNFKDYFKQPEFNILVETNAIGLRGPDVNIIESDNVVLCIGDSFTFGYGSNNDETYPARLQQLLPDSKVINAGVPGYGTDEELLMLRRLAPVLKPDVVIVQFFPGNDFLDNLTKASDSNTVEDGFLKETEHRKMPVLLKVADFLKSKSQLAYRVIESIKVMARRLGFMKLIKNESNPSFNDPKAREFTIQYLSQIQSECDMIKSKCLFVYVPPQSEVITEEVSESLAFIENSGFHFLNPTEFFKKNKDRMNLYYKQDGHFTPLGNSLFASFIFDNL